MAKTRKILRRLRSIRNIHEVTRAMYMISTARFKKAHDVQGEAELYLSGIADLAAETVAAFGDVPPPHPLMRQAEADAPQVLVVISSGRGLCGAYNHTIADLAAEHAKKLTAEGRQVLVRTSGRRGNRILEVLHCDIEKEYPQFDRTPDPAIVNRLADGLMHEFQSGAVSVVEVAYVHFHSAGQQKARIERLLPLKIESAGEKKPTGKKSSGKAKSASPAAGTGEPGAPAGGGKYRDPPLFLPGREAVLRRLIPEAVRAKFMRCFLHASVSEHVARMTAMRYASENAEELIHDLNVRYNRARQSQITTELAEIMGGRAGVEGM